MGLTRAECACMADGALQVAIDGRRSRLRFQWSRGMSGAIADVYDLALLLAESEVRGYAVKGVQLPDQLAFDFDAANAQTLSRRPLL